MPTASKEHTTIDTGGAATYLTARRRGLLAMLGGAATMGVTRAGPIAPDDRLIALCGDYLAIEAKKRAVYAATDNTLEAELRSQPELDQLFADGYAILEQITDVEPVTLAGASALARITLTMLDHDTSGKIMVRDDEECCVATVLEFLAGGANVIG